MNEDRIKGNWKQFKGKVQEQWGKLTDDDLDVIAGKSACDSHREHQDFRFHGESFGKL